MGQSDSDSFEGTRDTTPPSPHAERLRATGQIRKGRSGEPRRSGARQRRCCRATWPRSTQPPRGFVRHVAPTSRRLPGKVMPLRQYDPRPRQPANRVLRQAIAKPTPPARQSARGLPRSQWLPSQLAESSSACRSGDWCAPLEEPISPLKIVGQAPRVTPILRGFAASLGASPLFQQAVIVSRTSCEKQFVCDTEFQRSRVRLDDEEHGRGFAIF